MVVSPVSSFFVLLLAGALFALLQVCVVSFGTLFLSCLCGGDRHLLYVFSGFELEIESISGIYNKSKASYRAALQDLKSAGKAHVKAPLIEWWDLCFLVPPGVHQERAGHQWRSGGQVWRTDRGLDSVLSAF